MRAQPLIPALLVLLLAGCAEPPGVGNLSPEAQQAAYPVLLPFDTLQAMLPQTAPADPAAELAARAAALRARAAALRRLDTSG
ncbi:MAG: hypothetical protein R3E44_07430 [Paracoccaceae bacterium]